MLPLLNVLFYKISQFKYFCSFSLLMHSFLSMSSGILIQESIGVISYVILLRSLF